MKRKIWTLVALLMLVVLTAACIGGGTGGEAGSGSGSQQPADTPAETGQDENGASDPTEVPKLTVWHIEVGEQKNALEQAIKRFEEEHQVEVEFVQHENDPYKTNLVVAMGAGNPPDVFHSWGGGWLKQFADAGQVLDLTEKIDPSQYVGAALNATTFDDRIYGVPMTLGIAPVFYNKEIFEQYNLTPPETYSELLEIVDTLNENGIIPFALANQTKWPGALYLIYFADRIAGHELFDSAFARTGRGFDDPAYVRAGEMIQELVQRNAFPEGFNGLNYDTGQARALLYSGKAAMMLMTSGFISNVRDEAPEFEEKLDIFNFPAVEGGEGDPGHFSVFFRILFPLLAPATATVFIYNFVHTWNEFIFALVLIQSTSSMTLPLGLREFYGEYSVNIPAMMAALTLGSLPLLIAYFIGQEKIVQGLTAGALKG